MENLNHLTVAVVTYRRPAHLKSCLYSLFKQPHLPAKVLIIDNDYQKSAHKITARFINKFPDLTYINQPIKSIPRCRNEAINHCATRFIAFVDDDCILDHNWSSVALTALNSGHTCGFFQGRSLPLCPSNLAVRAHQQNYQNWINDNIIGSKINSFAIDTKNIIINLDLIRQHKISFDINLPIFEDVDFGLQLQQNHINGIYLPRLLVRHHEIQDILKLIKKYYYRGKIKYATSKKWGNYDSFINTFPPIVPLLKEIIRQLPHFSLSSVLLYRFLLEYSFQLGFRHASGSDYSPGINRIAIVNNTNEGANQERALHVSDFLIKQGFEVKIIYSEQLFDDFIGRKDTSLNSPFYLLYRITHRLIQTHKQNYLIPWRFYFRLKLRGYYLKKFLDRFDPMVVIIQNPEDMGLVNRSVKYKSILDLPTVYSEEIRLSRQYPSILVHLISTMESRAFTRADAVCFHWYRFIKYAQKIHKTPRRFFILNWGCSQTGLKASYNPKPKMVYLGKLNSEWINPSLLKSVKSKSPIPLDIYSYEKPSKNLYGHLIHSQFSPGLDIIGRYQFGLVTCSNDGLRNNGFSAKHLLYFSYGLPVFCPAWRRDPLLEPATIYYNRFNLKRQIAKYSHKKAWEEKHRQALKLAKQLNWENSLYPLLEKINEILDTHNR